MWGEKCAIAVTIGMDGAVVAVICWASTSFGVCCVLLVLGSMQSAVDGSADDDYRIGESPLYSAKFSSSHFGG